VVIGLALSGLALQVNAQQALIPFQGHLTQPVGGSPIDYEPVPNGQYDILFALYSSPVGGEGLLWGPERHEDLVVVNGLVNALLGSVLGFETELAADPNLFAGARYVGITIDADGNPNTADLELVPRQVLLPAMYAHNTDTLDGADWRDFFVGTGANGTFTQGITKARDADLFDGIDAAALLVDPNNTVNPKVKSAALADGIAGDLDFAGNLNVGGNASAAGNLTVGGLAQLFGNALIGTASDPANLDVAGDLVLGGSLTLNGEVLELGEAIGYGSLDSRERGSLRIGDLQIEWGPYFSSINEPFGTVCSGFLRPFLENNYAVVCTPDEGGAFRSLTIIEKRVECFVVQTWFQTGARSEDDGSFIAFGRWR
jgi:hypothetical protein